MIIFFAVSFTAAVAEEKQNPIRSMINSIWVNLFVDYYVMELLTTNTEPFGIVFFLLLVLPHLTASPRQSFFIYEDDRGLSSTNFESLLASVIYMYRYYLNIVVGSRAIQLIYVAGPIFGFSLIDNSKSWYLYKQFIICTLLNS